MRTDNVVHSMCMFIFDSLEMKLVRIRFVHQKTAQLNWSPSERINDWTMLRSKKISCWSLSVATVDISMLLWHNSTDFVFGCTFTYMRASTHTMLPSSTCIMYERVHVWSLANVIFSVELSLETVRRIPLLHSVQLPFSLPRFACLFGNCSIYRMCTPQFLCSAWVCCWVFGTL